MSITLVEEKGKAAEVQKLNLQSVAVDVYKNLQSQTSYEIGNIMISFTVSERPKGSNTSSEN